MSNSELEIRQSKSYELSWHTPDKVLLLTLVGNYTMEDAKEVDEYINEKLDQSQTPLFLLIDSSQMNRPYNFNEIRAVQTYMDHRQLKNIYVATNDRLVKLAMMVIFNMGRAYLHVFDDLEKATLLLQRQLSGSR